jgi:hypothetical protein
MDRSVEWTFSKSERSLETNDCAPVSRSKTLEELELRELHSIDWRVDTSNSKSDPIQGYPLCLHQEGDSPPLLQYLCLKLS